ncbi:MAG: Rrf2 family transcriptional regulator [Candidatus Omnitrophota bacterium]
MKLTTKSEYSLLALIYIARYEKEGFIKISRICSKYNIPKKYLEQLFLLLKQKRYLVTKTGSQGGYKLALSARKITLAQIVRLMDGALAPTESVSKYFFSHTPVEKEEKVTRVLKEIRDYVSNKLEHLKLADLV